jgi:hypothetical protein
MTTVCETLMDLLYADAEVFLAIDYTLLGMALVCAAHRIVRGTKNAFPMLSWGK